MLVFKTSLNIQDTLVMLTATTSSTRVYHIYVREDGLDKASSLEQELVNAAQAVLV